MTLSSANLPPIKETLTQSHSVRELYEISRGNRDEWGFGGYQVPGTIHYNKHSPKFNKEKRPDAYTEALKRKDWPGAASYSPKLNEDFERNWLKKGGGRIGKSPKKSIIDEIMQNEKKKPGPGEYFKDIHEKKANFTMTPKHVVGEKLSFLSTVEALSSEIPCSWKYNPYEKQKSLNKVSLWRKPKTEAKIEKEIVGPGCYEGSVSAKNATLPGSFKFSFAKAKSPDPKSSHLSKGPAVGQYSDAYFKTSMGQSLNKKKEQMKTSPIKSKRYLDDILKYAKTVPGPGAYDIGPPKEVSK